MQAKISPFCSVRRAYAPQQFPPVMVKCRSSPPHSGIASQWRKRISGVFVQALSIDESVQRIHAEYSQFTAEQIEDRLISWLEMGYAPEGYSEQQLDQLDRHTERWIKAHYRGRRRT